jgi:hypothetical protein
MTLSDEGEVMHGDSIKVSWNTKVFLEDKSRSDKIPPEVGIRICLANEADDFIALSPEEFKSIYNWLVNKSVITGGEEVYYLD